MHTRPARLYSNTDDCFLKHVKYGIQGHKLYYEYRAERLPYMLATALSELQAHGNASQWPLPEVWQHGVNFITAFNTIIFPAGGQRVPSDATPESIMQATTQNWIPLYVDAAVELPPVLANTVF